MEVRVLFLWAIEINVFLAHCRTVKQKKNLNIEKSTYTAKFYMKKKTRNGLNASLYIKDEDSLCVKNAITCFQYEFFYDHKRWIIYPTYKRFYASAKIFSPQNHSIDSISSMHQSWKDLSESKSGLNYGRCLNSHQWYMHCIMRAIPLKL